MRTVKIYIIDSAKLEEDEDLGFKKNNTKPFLVSFNFNEKLFGGYWIDPEENDDTGTFDIIFYVGGDVFKTPYKKETEEMFKLILS